MADAFTDALVAARGGGAAPPPTATADHFAEALNAARSEVPSASAARPTERAFAEKRFSDAFAEPLGPSDQFLDAIGLNPFGVSGFLRPLARGVLTLGDVGGRVLGATINTAGDVAGDMTEGVARLAPGLFSAEPVTAGNQAQREAVNLGNYLLATGGVRGGAGLGPRAPLPENALTAPVARLDAPANRLTAPVEAPMATVAPEAATAAETTAGPTMTATSPSGISARVLPQSATSPAASATSPSGITARLSDQPLPAQAIPEKLPRRPLLPIITESGAAKQADRIIQHFAEGGPTEANTAELLPGSRPTLAQATGNPGIATLERGFQSANPNAFEARASAADAARAQTYVGLAGTPADITAAEAARDAATSALRDKAFANPQPVDPLPVASKIKEILASPEGQRDIVKDALTRVYNKIVTVDPSNDSVVLQKDPAQLYGIRKAINDSLSPLARGTPSDARQASRELIAVKKALDETIETGAPGFRDYIKAYEEHSGPIDGMRYLQSLNLTDATGKIMLGKLDKEIKGIEKQHKLPGVRPADSITPEQLDVLKTIRDDMRREANSSLGKPIGSNTFQNFGTNALTAALGHPLVHGLGGGYGVHEPFVGLPLAAASYGLHKASQRGERLVQNALQQRLLNPEIGANALTKGR